MSRSFVLTTSAVPDPAPDDAQTIFYWPPTGQSSFRSNVGPGLGALGQVQELNVDLVRIASGVMAADRSVSRSGRLSAWNERSISIQVPVSDPALWAGVTDRLRRLLGFLTGDNWALSFVLEDTPTEQLATGSPGASRVVLFSGGADSAIGAALSAAQLRKGGEQHLLLSHYSATRLAPMQRRVAAAVEREFPGVAAGHFQVRQARCRTAPNGRSYGRENSTRSRSLLFLALGLAVASIERIPLWVPENGYASINPPLGTDRRGSLSTRTTHPAFLQELKAILETVGAHADFENPFASMTKGEMFVRLAEAMGTDEASEFISGTESCSHTGARSFGLPPNLQCGVCFGCALRRASFAASGLTDGTEYIDANGDERVERWLEDKSVIQAMRDFLEQPLRDVDIALLRAPRSMPLADVRDICERGRAELRTLFA